MRMRFIIERFGRSSKLKARNLVHVTAVAIAFAGASAVAQNTLEFIDPLEELRTQVEKTQGSVDKAEPKQKPARSAPEPSKTPAAALSGSEGTEAAGPGLVDKTRKAMADIAAQFGLSVSGLLGLLGLLLAGLIALVAWTLFRGKRHTLRAADDDIYENVSGHSRRRTLGEKHHPVKAEVSEDDEIFHESMPEGFDDIYREETHEARTFGKRADKSEALQSNDPATWKKPSMERLKDSIRADWKSSKAEKKAAAAAQVDNDWNVEDEEVKETSFFDPKGASRDVSQDPADKPMTEVADGWDEWDKNAQPGDDVWGQPEQAPKPTETAGNRDDALRRVRALRDSLRAS